MGNQHQYQQQLRILHNPTNSMRQHHFTAMGAPEACVLCATSSAPAASCVLCGLHMSWLHQWAAVGLQLALMLLYHVCGCAGSSGTSGRGWLIFLQLLELVAKVGAGHTT